MWLQTWESYLDLKAPARLKAQSENQSCSEALGGIIITDFVDLSNRDCLQDQSDSCVHVGYSGEETYGEMTSVVLISGNRTKTCFIVLGDGKWWWQ